MMAFGKYMLACGLLLLAATLIPLQAQQPSRLIESTSKDDLSGWATERTINPNPIDQDPVLISRETPKKKGSWFNWKIFSKSSKPASDPQMSQIFQGSQTVIKQASVNQAGDLDKLRNVPVGGINQKHGSVLLPPIRSNPNGIKEIQSIELTAKPSDSPKTEVPLSAPKPIPKDQLTTPVLASSPYVPVQMASPVGVVQVSYQMVEKQPIGVTDEEPVILKGVPLPPLGTVRAEESHLPPTSTSGASDGMVRVSGQTSAVLMGAPNQANSIGVVFAQPSPYPGGTSQTTVIPASNDSTKNTFPPTGPSYSPALPENLGSKQSLLVDQTGWVDPNQSHFYARGEYLLWWMNGYLVPPLVTTGPALLSPSTGGPDGATLDRADTRILFGGNTLSQGALSGVRLTVGWWCDWDCSEGIELSGFLLPQQSKNFTANSIQYPQISRPFTDQLTGAQSAQDTTFPGLAVGSIQVHAPSQFWGLEANLRCKLCCGDYCGNSYRIDLIGGPRYLNLGESISITENIQFTNNPNLGPFQNQRDIVNDSFATRNQFIGGQVGIDGQYNWDRWCLEGRAKLGLGDTIQSLVIQGSQTLPDQLGSRNGGLLALQSNIGRYSRNTFSVVPEIGINLGYKFTDNIRATVGYNLLAWTNVLRPGDQINPILDSSLIPQFPPVPKGSGLEPSVPFKESTFWAQGLTLGLEFRY